MKKLFIVTISLLMAGMAVAQTAHEAEYNLIRRTYTTNSDGSLDINFRKELKILRNRAFTAYADKGETFITYNPDFETLTINECYTITADGKKVETPRNAFVLQLPSECTDCGRLNNIQELAIVHTALEYNCVIVLDYTLHRHNGLYVERFNYQQDCPVKRYEVIYPDGHREAKTNIPPTTNYPYMPSQKQYDVEFQHGTMPTYTTEKSLPVAANVLASLKKADRKEYAAAIRNWVIDNVHLNNIDLARVNYAMTPATDVFNSNCGTVLDKTGLLAAMLNEAGFQATIKDNTISVFGDRPMDVEVMIEGKSYRLSATQKGAIMTESEKADAAAVAAAPIYVDRELDWKPDTITDKFVRITLPAEPNGININPAYLFESAPQQNIQGKITNEFYHYTMNLPKGAKLIGGDVVIDYTCYDLGSINIIIKQKGNRLLITRNLQIRKAIITQADYASFRRMIQDWNSHKELIFSL